MKRMIVTLLFVAFAFDVVQAQVGVYRSGGVIKKVKKEHQENKKHKTPNPANIPVKWIDLGLPSGLLWAECNLGSTTPEGYGNYYAWGETSTKRNYSWITYAYGSDYNQLSKYFNYSSSGRKGFTDNLTTLQPIDDAATTVLGKGSRMPTSTEWQELLDNTTATWTTQDGVSGLKITAANGNSLFLPAAGNKGGKSLIDGGTCGFYWSSSHLMDHPGNATCLHFGCDFQRMSKYGRNCGLSVRAVRSTH